MILFMFPFAGGSSLSFQSWLPYLSSKVHVVPLDIPGISRAYPSNAQEISIPEMANRVLSAINPFIIKGEPFAFLGYSMGALLAFETARQLSSLPTSRMPTYLFVCACSAPGLKREPIHMLDDESFDRALRKYGGTLPEILENEELMELIRPTLRRDIKASEVYEVAIGSILECPIDALGGTQDDDVPEDDLTAWSRFTTRFGQIRTFRGDHFFINGREAEVSHYVISRLISAGLLTNNAR